MLTQTTTAQTTPSNGNGSASHVEMHDAPFSWNVRATSQDGFDEQFTVRAVTPAGFFERIAYVKAQLIERGYTPAPVRSAAPNTTATAGPDADAAPVCAIHKTPMQERTGRNGQKFWSCATKLENGEWCPYRPPK